MWMNDLRTLMLRALLLDWFGQVLILAIIMSIDAWYGIDLGVDSESLQGAGALACFRAAALSPAGLAVR